MAGADFELGRLCLRPADFAPTKKITDSRYYYQLDFRSGVAKRTPLHWSDPGGVAYFVLEAKTATQRRFDDDLPGRQIGHRVRRVITGLAVTAMASSLFLLIYPYYPAVQYSVGSKLGYVGNNNAVVASDQVSPVNKLYIPKIGVTANILEGSSLNILNKEEGVWHQTGLANGNLVLAGHRWKYLPPNTTTFYNLNKLQPGDRITVDWEGKRYYYAVTADTVVPETDLLVLNQTDQPQLTLYTCNDFRQTQRIVITASLLP